MFELIVTIFGIAASALYVGYLAFAIKSIPLWVIVIATFALIVREFVVEFRTDADRPRNERGGKSSR